MINFKKTQLLGHRGARVEALENTLFGFQHAKRLQAKGLAGVELDVQLTADGHLIVFHDDTLQRLCGLQARIDQLSLRETQRHTQSGHHIITLDMLAQSLPLSMSAPAFKPQRQALNSLLGVNTISSDKAYEITELSSQAHTLSQFEAQVVAQLFPEVSRRADSLPPASSHAEKTSKTQMSDTISVPNSPHTIVVESV
mgnify:CR=1 FL=1